jgi:hypothetical protein
MATYKVEVPVIGGHCVKLTVQAGNALDAKAEARELTYFAGETPDYYQIATAVLVP